MRRSLHLLVIGAILPGVMLPVETAFCFCAAVACHTTSTCCEATSGRAAAAPGDCCSKRQSTTSTYENSSRCRGCVVLVTHKPTSPKVQKHDVAIALPQIVAPLDVVPMPADRDPAPRARPTSHAPPDSARNTPLLI